MFAPVLIVAIGTAHAAEPLTPLAVVERGYAWVGAPCDSTTDSSVALDVPWVDKQLVLMTPTHVGPRGFVDPVCVRGECSSDEVGVLVGDSHDFGVLLDAAEITDAKVRPLSPVGTGEACFDRRTPTRKDSFRTCVTYAPSADSDMSIQVRADGQLQENGRPIYGVIEWRINPRSPWLAVPRPFKTDVPRPIGRISSESRDEIVWLSQNGICCPSDSWTWVSYRSEGSWMDGRPVSGGRGQPCD